MRCPRLFLSSLARSLRHITSCGKLPFSVCSGETSRFRMLTPSPATAVKAVTAISTGPRRPAEGTKATLDSRPQAWRQACPVECQRGAIELAKLRSMLHPAIKTRINCHCHHRIWVPTSNFSRWSTRTISFQWLSILSPWGQPITNFSARSDWWTTKTGLTRSLWVKS